MLGREDKKEGKRWGPWSWKILGKAGEFWGFLGHKILGKQPGENPGFL